MKRRVVVTGIGVVSPLACDVGSFWQHLVAGKSGIRRLSSLNLDDFKVHIGGEVVDFDATGFCDAKELKRLDRFTLFALVAGGQAVRQAGLDFASVDVNRCGVILGSGIGGLHEIEQQMERLFGKGPDRVSPFTVPKMMLNAAGGNVAIQYGLRGPNHAVATACASATNAMGDALRMIQEDLADVVITGGTEAAITRMGLAAFQNMKALSARNDAPHLASRPFDRDRDGFVLSEGAGLLVFESLQHALRRGARPLAEVIGYGASCDAGHITQPDVAGTGAAAAMSAAIRDGGLEPHQIDYINAHGTSTPLGDAAETCAIKNVFGSHATRVAISSTKSMLGHSLGASGGLEAAVSVLSIQHGMIHPTINLEHPDPACDLDYTPREPRELAVKRVMSNSFGFGGHNASIIFGAVD
jgi:3-oxoacyl-[acyl-carrier-protein] synthase II